MKNNQNPRLTALKVLNNVFNDGAYANISLSKNLVNQTVSDENRRFITEIVYGTIKAKGTLDWIIEKHVNRKIEKISPVILNILRMGVYQIFFSDKTPDSAACNEAVKLTKKFGHTGTVKFVNAVLRNCSRKKEGWDFKSETNNLTEYISLSEFHPQWLVKRWLGRFGEKETIELCEYNNQAKPLSIRVNSLKVTRDDLVKKLEELGAEVSLSKWSKDGIICDKIPSMKTIFEKFGDYIYIQDESSMLVASFLNPVEGSTVIDVCSAPGGKTTHIAQIMNNKGKVIATDIHQHKLKLIEENATRLGINIIETHLQDASENVSKWQETADFVLVDAPCSGLGVLGRRAEARWRKTKSDLAQFPVLQSKILQNASTYLKSGGSLVYSTCTIEPAENQEIIEEFLKKNKNFELEPIVHPITNELVQDICLLPQRDKIDGFYICKLKKVEKS